MSPRLGTISFESGQDEIFIGRSMAQARPYSDEVASIIDEEVKALIDKAYLQCEEILRQHMDKVTQIAEYLLENETMDAQTFESLFDPTPPSPSAINSTNEAAPGLAWAYSGSIFRNDYNT